MTYRDALADMSTDELVRLDSTLSDIFRELINILKAEINNEAMKGVRV